MKQRSVLFGSVWISTLFVSQIYAGVQVVPPKPVPRPTVYLIAVGLNDYSDPTIGQLRTAAPEAIEISRVLTDRNTGLAQSNTSTVLVGSKATRAEILNAISVYRAKLAPNDVLVLYWAGHSQKHDAERADIHLLAYDSKRSDRLSAISLVSDIIPSAARPDAYFVFIWDGSGFNINLARRLQPASPNVSILSAAKADEFVVEEGMNGSAFARALERALRTAGTDIDNDGFLSVEEVYIATYAKSARAGEREEHSLHPTLSGDQSHKAILARAPIAEEALSFHEKLPEDFLTVDTILLNGERLAVDKRRSQTTNLVLLGDISGRVRDGLNYLTAAKAEYLFWSEEKALRRFTTPYNNSYALVAAIDDYDRTIDPLKRGPSGYEARGMMVGRARELVNALRNLGFPAQNIIELYNQDATSSAIDSTLKTFWRGGKREHADRLVVYFGGHGDAIDNTGLLVTYDFDKRKPTQTGFLMNDLSSRHAQNIVAKHVLFTLDACASGLAIYKRLGPSLSQERAFARLSAIRNDTEERARAFLVAGTENQAVLWDDGGIFTQALISGLKGGGDANRDQIIQFHELANFVSNEVAARAARKGVRQQVGIFVLDDFGSGKVLFVMSNPGARP